MGILNVTPDSFSDGGKFLSASAALEQAERMVAEGADVIDVGGESSRPGAAPVSLEEERSRVVPVLEALRARLDVRLSIDTRKFEMMEAAIDLGVTLINDISGGSDIRLPQLLQKHPHVQVILMHMKGMPATMQKNPIYPDGVVSEVKKFLEGRVRAFAEHGIQKDQLWVDPGFGFGKSTSHNLDLLRHLNQFASIGQRLVVGTSRKSFLSKVLHLEEAPMEARDAGTLATGLWALSKGASVFRVHEVSAMKRAIRTWEAIESGESGSF
jgi:dihydropteroate synthase